MSNMPWTVGSLLAAPFMYLVFGVPPNAGWLVTFLFCLAMDVASAARKGK